MATTFDPALLTARDRVRFQLGDTDMAKPLIPDETYDAQIAWYGGDEQKAARELARGLIAEYGRKPVNIKAGSVQVDYRERLTVWRGIVGRIDIAVGGGGSLSSIRTSRFDDVSGEYRK